MADIEQDIAPPQSIKRPTRIHVADTARLIASLQWVDEVYPDGDAEGGAFVVMTWEQWNALRTALGLPDQPIRKRSNRGGR